MINYWLNATVSSFKKQISGDLQYDIKRMTNKICTDLEM